jgi:NADH-quinone oxidoreductase subunit G/NADP-reducing hydrogenase subunit HndD
MFGALVKTYYAEKMGIDPANIVSVSIMPCTAKKFECQRPEMNASATRMSTTPSRSGTRPDDQGSRHDFKSLPEEEYDAPLGISTGAAVIFGATGGVMEAALRTAYELYTGKTLEKIDFEPVRGLTGIKTATVDANGTMSRSPLPTHLPTPASSWTR